MNPIFTLTDLLAVTPLCTMLIGLMILLLIETFTTNSKRYVFLVTFVVLLFTFFTTFYAPVTENPVLTDWIRFDSLGTLFTRFFLLIGLGTACIASMFFQGPGKDSGEGEYYFLLLSALIGLILIGIAADFLTLFIGLETLSLSLYILCGYMKAWRLSPEAAIKYFLMGALAAAILLYGIALVYGAIGTTRFSLLLERYQEIHESIHLNLFLSGIALITAGIAFKATIVPFHAWAPDVYAGAPTPVTALMSIGTKIGAFAAFLIIFSVALSGFHPLWNHMISLFAYPTLIFSNLVALKQTHLRRFFAYSGISHAGFLLIPLATNSPETVNTTLFYLIVYATATLGAFAVIATLDTPKEPVRLSSSPQCQTLSQTGCKEAGEDISIEKLRGLFQHSPFLASLMGLSLLTLAGLPPTAGFLAKFYIFKIAFNAGLYPLVLVGLVVTLVSIFYYMKMIGLVFSRTEEGEVENKRCLTITWSLYVVAAITFFGLVSLACFPSIAL